MPKQRWLFVIRHSSFVILVAFLLSACGLSTETVATVGGQAITRGELAAAGAGSTPASQAAALNNLVYGELIELEARAQKITVTDAEVNAQNKEDIAATQGPDGFVQALQQQRYPSSAAYFQTLRQQLLIQKMRPIWFTGTVDAVTLQLLTTDSQQKAQEVTQKGRAGASFDDLLKQYAPAGAQTPEAVNSPGSLAISRLNPQVRAAFPEIKEGVYSDPLPANGGQYAVLRIAKVEKRAPTEQEGQDVLLSWLESLKAKYPVTITDPALRTAGR
ncbi:MAG TPA: peptidylprolyl isomerase [Thermomicrobiales bacterium]